MRFSLVLATIHREVEPFSFLRSLESQIYKNFEVVFVDQNEHDRLKVILENSEDAFSFPIKYIKIAPSGLSNARNVGLRYVTGDILAFPDDDCEYLPNTLSSVKNLFFDYPAMDVVKGKIVNREGGDSLKNWKKKPFKIKPFNVFFTASSVTMFIKRANNPVVFDEHFGAGSKFGSCEDVDLIFRLLSLNKVIWYFPTVHIYHPDETIQDLGREKISHYGRGFGAFTRKNLTVSNFINFVVLLGFHFVKGCFALIKMDVATAKKRFLYLRARIEGFLHYDS
jgi:glycosyltransferase involved in cell wall biosynthesis